MDEKTFTARIRRDTDWPYLLYLPSDYDADGQPAPLILFLHGAGERGEDGDIVRTQGLPAYIESGHDLPFIVVAPVCPPDQRWEYYRDDLIQLLDHITAAHNVDATRVYLTGLSMGGFGTWDLARLYPQRFAAIAPICGGLSWEIDLHAAARVLKHMPTWAFHGERDDVVLPEQTTRIIDAIREQGGQPELTLYPDARHDSWTATYRDSHLYEWFLAHSLTR